MRHKNPPAIPEIKTAIQSEIDAISEDTLTKVLNNFVLRLCKFLNLRGSNSKKKCLEQQTNFPNVWNDQ